MKSRIHYALKALRSRLPVGAAGTGASATRHRTAMSCRGSAARSSSSSASATSIPLGAPPRSPAVCAACREEVGLDRALVVSCGAPCWPGSTSHAAGPRSWDRDAHARPRRRPAAAPLRLAVALDPARARRRGDVADDLRRGRVAGLRTAAGHPGPQLAGLEQSSAAEPEWEMPWWLSARTGPPPAPPVARAARHDLRRRRRPASRMGPS